MDSVNGNDPARAVFRAQIVSLAVTAWIVWKIVYFPMAAAFFPSQVLISLALWYSLCAAAISVAVTAALVAITGAVEHAGVFPIALQTAAAGVWLAPAFVLWRWPSAWAAGAGAAMAGAAGRLLYSQWRRRQTIELPHGLLGDTFLPRQFGRSISLALILEFGLIAVLAPVRQTVAILCALTAGVLMVHAIRLNLFKEQKQEAWQRAMARAMAMAIVAALFVIVAGLQIRFGRGAGHEAGRIPARLPRMRDVAPPSQVSQASLGGEFSGIILRPEVKPIPILVEPMPVGAAMERRLASRPFIIPFSGDYWMFRWPFTEPPPNSVVRTGTPIKNSFKTVDAFPLEMQARQFLDHDIELSWCKEIDVEIQNADRYPGTVSLELTVLKSNGRMTVLGTQPIASRPDLAADPVAPVHETLHFPVSESAAATAEFDQIMIVFRRMRMRSDKSARISIDRFLLIGK